MGNAYTPPGVTVTEISSNSVAPFIAPGSNLCVVGVAGTTADATSPITTTDTVILQGTSAVTLPTIETLNNDAILVEVLAVRDVLNPSVGTPPGTGYTVTTDYTVATGEGPPDGSNASITRVGAGAIPDGALVSVQYTYLPSDYWNPVRLFDIGSVENRFGPSWRTATSNVTGQTYNVGINSQLSMAARLAFTNGAQSVICQPLFARATPGNAATAQQAPTATQVGEAATWEDTLYNLRTLVDVDIIVPIIGEDNTNVTDSDILNVFSAVQSHLYYMNVNEESFIIAIFGEDGTIEGIGSVGNNGNATGLINTVRNVHAPYLQSSFGNALSSQCVLINNTAFQLPVPGLNTTLNVGGQYCAAAVGGALSARSVSQALTRQGIIGFQSVSDPRKPSDKNLDAGAGLMVIEETRGGAVRCRQSNTLDIRNGPPKAELSVVRAKFNMIASIRDTLDNQIIGNIIADANSPIIVRSAISGVLALLQQAGDIVGYSNVTAALTNLNPTTVTASFSYQPAFPLNFIHVTFSLDLTNGAVSVAESVGPGSAVTSGS